jgi:hypothetical protein
MVGGTSFHRGILKASRWSHEQKQSNTKSNSKTKTFYEGKSQNLRTVHVSLDNADTVIDAPHIRVFCECVGVRTAKLFKDFSSQIRCERHHRHPTYAVR